MKENKCLFCKIINREVSAERVYEDDEFIAFLDINPVNPGHTLVVPKKHSVNILDTDEIILSKIAIIIKKVTKGILRALDYEDFNIEVNNGKNAGQIISHAHWHIIPRNESDGLKNWSGGEYKEGEISLIAQRIKKEII